MLSGGLAAASTLFVTYPMDLGRVKLATDLSVEGKGNIVELLIYGRR